MRVFQGFTPETPSGMPSGCTGICFLSGGGNSGRFVAEIRENQPSTGQILLTLFVSPRSNVRLQVP